MYINICGDAQSISRSIIDQKGRKWNYSFLVSGDVALLHERESLRCIMIM